jgi:hypothetical protein
MHKLDQFVEPVRQLARVVCQTRVLVATQTTHRLPNPPSQTRAYSFLIQPAAVFPRTFVGRDFESESERRATIASVVPLDAQHAMTSSIATGFTPFFRCPACGGILDEQPRVAEVDVVHRIGESLCTDELMMIFAHGINRGADPGHGYVLQMLEQYIELAERLAVCALRRGAEATAAELKQRARAARRRAVHLREPYCT